jgi:hypothetical protein
MISQDELPGSSAMASLLSARAAALEAPELYKEVLPPVLGVVSDKPSLAVRRWVSSFIAEALSSIVMLPEDGENVALMVLPAIKGFLQDENEDEDVVKNSIISASAAYPIAFRHVYVQTWNNQTGQN